METKEDEEYYEQAVEVTRIAGRGSTSFLQRKLRIGYFRAQNLIQLLLERGVLKPKEQADSKPYEVNVF